MVDRYLKVLPKREDNKIMGYRIKGDALVAASCRQDRVLDNVDWNWVRPMERGGRPICTREVNAGPEGGRYRVGAWEWLVQRLICSCPAGQCE